MLWVKSASRLRRPASLTEGFCGVDEGTARVLGAAGLGLRFLSEPLAGWVVEELEVAEVVGWSFESEWAWEWECPPSPVAIRNDLSIATNATKPAIMPTPRRRLRLGSRSTNLTLSGWSSPRNISGSRWKSVSPRSPPTANATMMVRDAGSTLGGHSARRKFGGPEMYAVASRAFMAGELDGKRMEKMRVVMEADCEVVATLWALSFWTTEHCYLKSDLSIVSKHLCSPLTHVLSDPWTRKQERHRVGLLLEQKGQEQARKQLDMPK